jgi:hypothetical protein
MEFRILSNEVYRSRVLSLSKGVRSSIAVSNRLCLERLSYEVRR